MDSRPSPAPGGHTRRSFVTRSGLLAGAFWLAATGWDKTIGRAIAASMPDPTGRQRRTYVALVDAVSATPGSGVSGGSAAEIAARFDHWYSAQAPHTQRQADSVLDDLEANFDRGRSFHGASREDRLEFLRDWHHGPYRNRAPHAESAPDRDEQRHTELIIAYARRPENRADPTDFSTAKPAPSDRSASSHPRRQHSADDVRRGTFAQTVLALAAAPDYIAGPQHPEHLGKVPAIEV